MLGITRAGVKKLLSNIDTSENAIGVNQTWQDVLVSRSSGVTYTNTTGKPIEISVSVSANGGGASIYVDGVIRSRINNNNSSYYASGQVAITVPNNSTYSVVLTASSFFQYWSELR